jgi:hypothetical protein
MSVIFKEPHNINFVWSKSMRRKFITILSLMAMTGNVLAAELLSKEESELLSEEKKPTSQVISKLDDQTIDNVKQKIRDYSKASVDPKSILVVFDVDGTLTAHSYPTSDFKNVEKRRDSVEFVRFLLNQGIKVVISSAWSPFGETIKRLNALELGDALGLKGVDRATKYDEKQINVRGMDVSYQKEGKVVSVRGSWSNDWFYYRQKAIAPYLVYRPEILDNEIQYVLFPDDSSGNTATFLKDVKTQKLYPNAKEIIAFTLINPDYEKPSLISSLSKSGSWHRKSGEVCFKIDEKFETDESSILNHEIPETSRTDITDDFTTIPSLEISSINN